MKLQLGIKVLIETQIESFVQDNYQQIGQMPWFKTFKCFIKSG